MAPPLAKSSSPQREFLRIDADDMEAEPPRDDTENADSYEECEGREDFTNHLLLSETPVWRVSCGGGRALPSFQGLDRHVDITRLGALREFGQREMIVATGAIGLPALTSGQAGPGVP